MASPINQPPKHIKNLVWLAISLYLLVAGIAVLSIAVSENIAIISGAAWIGFNYLVAQEAVTIRLYIYFDRFKIKHLEPILLNRVSVYSGIAAALFMSALFFVLSYEKGTTAMIAYPMLIGATVFRLITFPITDYCIRNAFHRKDIEKTGIIKPA